MDTGNSILSFDISEVSEGCNYSDDILAVTKKQSPNSLNVEFFNGRIRKRPGELAFTTLPTGQGGIDTYTKILLHCDGTNASTIFTDSASIPKTVTAHEGAKLSTVQSKFGTASGLFSGTFGGIDLLANLMLHLDNNVTDSETVGSAKIVTNNNGVTFSNTTAKFGYAAKFNGTNQYLSTPYDASLDFGVNDFTCECWVNSPDWSAGGTNPTMTFFNSGDEGGAANASWILRWNNSGSSNVGNIEFYWATATSGGSSYSASAPFLGAWTPSNNTWYHLAVVRAANNFYMFINGLQLPGSPFTFTETIRSSGDQTNIGARTNGAVQFFNGYMDEIRICNNNAQWTDTFTPSTAPYSTIDYLTIPNSSDFDFSASDGTIDMWVYPLYLNTINVLFTTSTVSQVSNTMGFILADGTIKLGINGGGALSSASGVVNLNQWQHIAFVRQGSTNTIYVNGTSVATDSGSWWTSSSQPFYIGAEILDKYLYNGYMDEFRVSKGIARWIANFTPPSLAYDSFVATVASIGFSLFDFSDVNQHHKQIAHLGSIVYAYDQITATKTILRNGAPYVRSFNSKVGAYLIQTYNDYSVPYYWDGSAASMALVSTNAPGFKRTIEFQGYMIGMNTAANKTRCYYQLITNLLGGGAAYSDYFTLTPAPNDDEISDPFILNGRLYAGTKYGIFRISFVGGVTIFEFKQVVSTVGVVPNTAQVVVTRDFGQVVIFLGTDKRLYLFDGANLKTISDLFYYSNSSTPIAMDLIDDNYKENSFAIYDTIRRIYRLFITKKASSKNLYCLNIDVETFAYYPFDNMQFSSGTIGYDALLRPFVLCTDYIGVIHKMFIINNTDNGTAINEYYDSPIVSLKNSTVKKAETLTLTMTPSSSANLRVYEKVDFSSTWRFLQNVIMASSRDKFLGRSMVLGSAKLGSEKGAIYPQIGLATSFNYYQFRLVSDTPTLCPWEIYDINFDESILKFGRAEAQR